MADSRIEELRLRVERDPGSRLFAQLAEEHRKAGAYSEAIRVARAGLAVHPQYPSARVTLGWALLDSGDAAAARLELEEAVRQAPDNILARRCLAQVFQQLKQPVAALEQYAGALKRAPGDPLLISRIRELVDAIAPAEASAPRTEVAATDQRAGGSSSVSGGPAGVAAGDRAETAGTAPTSGGEPDDAEAGGAAPPMEAEAAARRIEPPAPARVEQPAPTRIEEPAGGTSEAAGFSATAVPAAEAVATTGHEAAAVEGATTAGDATFGAPPVDAPGPPAAPGPEALGFDPNANGVARRNLAPTDRLSLAQLLGRASQARALGAPSAGQPEPPEPSAAVSGPPPAAATPPRDVALHRPGAASATAPAGEARGAELPTPAEGPAAIAAVQPGRVALPQPMAGRVSDLAAPGPARQGAPSVPLEPPPDDDVAEGATPFSSSTLAELYLRQGLRDRALDVYRQVVTADPGNERARVRLEQIEGETLRPTTLQADPHEARRRALQDAIERLEGLLAAVRRR